MKTTYICQLPTEIQMAIIDKLVEAGVSSHNIQKAMNGRLCDLEDIIDIKEWI